LFGHSRDIRVINMAYVTFLDGIAGQLLSYKANPLYTAPPFGADSLRRARHLPKFSQRHRGVARAELANENAPSLVKHEVPVNGSLTAGTPALDDVHLRTPLREVLLPPDSGAALDQLVNDGCAPALAPANPPLVHEHCLYTLEVY